MTVFYVLKKLSRGMKNIKRMKQFPEIKTTMPEMKKYTGLD